MGVERAVTRWYVLRQPIIDEIAALEARLHQLEPQTSENADAATPVTGASESALLYEVEQQLKRAQTRLKAIGSCPKPMM